MFIALISLIESDVPTRVHGSDREGICYLGPEHYYETCQPGLLETWFQSLLARPPNFTLPDSMAVICNQACMVKGKIHWEGILIAWIL